MQNLYLEVTTLDRRSIEKFHLSEEVMMEHAAMALDKTVRETLPQGKNILIVCGSGNNGADGLALARLLSNDYNVDIHLPFGASTPMCQLQRERLEALGLKHTEINTSYDLIVDALFGSGLNRPLGPTAITVMEAMNSLQGIKVACDVPSGLHAQGSIDPHVFYADITITMGGYKRALYSDAAKEIVGKIFLADLGLPRKNYSVPSSWQLLEKSDLHLPHRTRTSSHKGSYGHLGVICGEKNGAAVIAASAALRFGTGLVSLISNENVTIPYELMQSHSLPSTTTAVALGMGLGTEFCDDELTRLTNHSLPMVLDADIFYHPMFLSLLQHPSLVLTPHPKEFVQILRVCGIADIDVQTLQNNRFTYVEMFCSAFPNVVLVLKGSNVIIGLHETFYLNPHGTVALAKGGSGDVLGGLIGALLAQGYQPLDAAIQGSLAHTIASQSFDKNNYALTPFDLIEKVACL